MGQRLNPTLSNTKFVLFLLTVIKMVGRNNVIQHVFIPIDLQSCAVMLYCSARSCKITHKVNPTPKALS